jgi:glutamate-5-semialdehyde dehydrogenase
MSGALKSILNNIKHNSVYVAQTSEVQRNEALRSIGEKLWQQRARIFEQNEKDMALAVEQNLPDTLFKRLRFDEAKLKEVLAGIEELISLPDPLERTLLMRELDRGLVLRRISCPIGVIGVIFESRPDALVQIATLCLKSGNCAILKGGSETANTNRILHELIREAAVESGIDSAYLTLLESRSQIGDLLECEDSVDLLIPRGSNEFVSYIMDHTKIPVMGHAAGVCHVYVDRSADIELALSVVLDAKLQYVVVCNTAETLLVHEDIAGEFLPALSAALAGRELELRGDEKTASIIPCTPATEADYGVEFGDRILAVRVVPSTEEAIRHINRYGSGHTDAILSSDEASVGMFFSLVDSASVMHNCSTRFADGYRYGFGAEVGISTGKLHARGPVGLEGLTTYKYQLRGEGHIVAPYATGEKKFHFRDL